MGKREEQKWNETRTNKNGLQHKWKHNKQYEKNARSR